MEVKIKLLNENALCPQKATMDAIGYDLYVPNDICIEHVRQTIPLGFALELPYGIEAKIEPRSGFSSKGIEGFALKEDTSVCISINANCGNTWETHEGPDNGLWQRIDKTERFNADVLVGKVDPDYRGEVGVIIRNNEPDKHFVIPKGTRIAQMTLYKTETADFKLCEELSTVTGERVASAAQEIDSLFV